MLIRIIITIIIGLVPVSCGFVAGRSNGKRAGRWEAEERARTLKEEEAQTQRDTYCVHCVNGLMITKESGQKTMVVGVACALGAECPSFKRETAPGQARKLKWTSR